jgi:hypothetical protein
MVQYINLDRTANKFHYSSAQKSEYSSIEQSLVLED